MPAVSVIIPTFNRLAMLEKAVSSVLDQSFDDIEIIIVDDGSADGTFNRFNKGRLPLRYIYQPRMGVSAARNRGIKLASGNYIAFLDSDDLWLPRKLEIQVQYLEENPNVLICQTEEIWIRNGKRVNPGYRHLKPSGDIFDRSLELCVVSPSAVMMRKEFFDKAGYFDENLPACEDYDLWLRTSIQMEVPLLSEMLTIRHGGHEDQLSQKYGGMDRFRVYALQKLLQYDLTEEQRQKVAEEIRKKCRIILVGSVKRRRYVYALKTVLTQHFPGINWGILGNSLYFTEFNLR